MQRGRRSCRPHAGKLLTDEALQVADARCGVLVDIPLSLAPHGHGRHWFRISAEEQWFDPGDRAGLPFLRDGFVRLEFLTLYAGRTSRSFGW